MRIRALRTVRGDSGTIRRGAEEDIPDTHAKSLIQRGLAEEVEEDPADKPPKAPKPHMSAGQPRTKAKAKESTKGATAPKTGE